MVMALMAALLAVVLPAYSVIVEGAKQSQMDNSVKAALGAARTHAIKTQKYAGVRFQFDRDGWRKGRQYAVLIEEPDTKTKADFVPSGNVKPMRLPRGMGVLCVEGSTDGWLDDSDVGLNDGTKDPCCLNGAVTFSILFSPRGQLVRKEVDLRARNYDDKIINHVGRVELNRNDELKAILYSDAGWVSNDPKFSGDVFRNKPWCYQEDSSLGLRVFEVDKMVGVDRDYRYTDYVSDLSPVLINRYTGSIIE